MKPILDDLTFDLMEVYNNLHPESSDSESDSGTKKTKKKKGETGFAAFNKQPKKKCNNCGAWGHISKFCKGKTSHAGSPKPSGNGRPSGGRGGSGRGQAG